jgi:cytochrome c-type biogenesis protein CcmE
VELTPRRLDDEVGDDLDAGPDGPGGPGTGARSRRGGRGGARRRWLPLAVIGVVLVAIGFFVYRGLSDAALYFRNADEAVAQRDTLGERRFRLQGSVVDDPVRTGESVEFEVSYNDVVVEVQHQGDPPELFRPGVPVVLEGHWSPEGAYFDSDRILIKHDEEYQSRKQYEERERRAEEGGQE